MEKGDLIVGRVKLNPIGNEFVPCIKIIMCEGLGHNDLVLLKVVNESFDWELKKLEDEIIKLKKKK